MGIVSGIVVYLLLFWTVLFTVLPWGNTPPDEKETGHAGGAPAMPRIRQKFMVTGIVAAVLWLIVALLMHIGIIDFHAFARQMLEEDI